MYVNIERCVQNYSKLFRPSQWELFAPFGLWAARDTLCVTLAGERLKMIGTTSCGSLFFVSKFENYKA